MTFDKEIGERFGIIYGDSKLIFIKTGRGGSIYGYNNKYLKLSKHIRDCLGYSVVISANPENSECDLHGELQEIKDYVPSYDETFYIGISNGAIVGAQQGYIIDDVKKMLLVNGPLIINPHKTIMGLEKFCGNTCLVYGDNDPSYPYLKILQLQKLPNVEVKVVVGADHNFSNKEEQLESSIIEFLQ